MPKADSLPTPIPPQQEYRALEMMASVPQGCMLFPVMDDRSYPHLRRGEIAVVDTTDREPQHNEVFVIQWSSGGRCITQLLNRTGFSKNPDHWWTSALTARAFIPGMGESRMVDGPRTTAGMRKALVGRVVGLVQSLPIEAAE